MDFADPTTLTRTEIETGASFAPRFDAHGLITAVATDAGTGQVLMVAHMNGEALGRTLASGEVHYFSRSRNRIWKKGETSGEIQKLVEMRVDCDQDVLWLAVNPTGRGAACHTGRRSCFYRRVVADGETVGLVDLGDEPLFDPAEIYRA
jgi:phosphoribosyl-AMP cyclohydrolase